MKTFLSVIVPTHNSESTIQRCISSLISQSFPREQFEIIVVDDGSKDKTTTLAKETGADQIIVTEPCYVGKARNIGVQKAKTNFLAFHIVFLANISFARGFWDEIGNFKTKSQICN